MTDRPILFSAPMIQALLAGAKSQTRRTLKVQPIGTPYSAQASLTKSGSRPVFYAGWDERAADGSTCCFCPYGVPGDRLWVREAWGVWFDCYVQDSDEPTWYRADQMDPDAIGPSRWRPSIHMPRHRSRILLEVTEVRVERLQHISEADAIAEGIERGEAFPGWYRHSLPGDSAELSELGKSCRIPTAFPTLAYRALWEAINGPGSWDENPWVWVLSFQRIAP